MIMGNLGKMNRSFVIIFLLVILLNSGVGSYQSYAQEIDPSVMTGHNIFGFDLPYLSYCFIERNPHHKNDIYLGKDGSSIKYSPKPKKFRKDGSQSYDYHEAKIFGRQIIDTFFLAIKFDFGRKYPSYGLKPIIEAEGLEKKGRIIWDFKRSFCCYICS